MAKALNLNRVDTAVSGVTTLTLPRAILNFAADFKVVSVSPTEAIMTNLTSPIDAPEKIRMAVTPVKDVYKNTGIDPTMYPSSRGGVNILAQITDTFTVTDSAVPEFITKHPISAHLVLKVPADALVTEDVVVAIVGRLVSLLFGTGETNSTRMKALLRGVLLPFDI